MQGHPFDLKELCAYATEISGKTLGKNWPQKYVARVGLTAAKASGLDPA